MKRHLVYALLAVALAFGGFYCYHDYQYRQLYGTVTQVSLVSWDQEVLNAKDKTPVLVYFYKDSDKHPADDAQGNEVKAFAWSHAGEVKVVAVNVSHLENLPLALAHGALRQPGFAIVSGDDIVTGPAGVFTSKQDLERLFHSATRHLAMKNSQ